MKSTKYIISLSVILVLLQFSASIAAQQNKVKKDIKNTSTKILNLCKTNNFIKAANYIAYHGNDKKRENKDNYNITNKEERLKVNKICRKIKSLQLISKNYKFETVKINRGKSGRLYTLKIKFNSSDQSIGIKFVFVKAKGQYLLSNIE